MQRLIRDDRVQDLKLNVADGLVAQRSFPRAPLETLHDALLDRVEQGFVDFTGQGVIEQRVGTLLVRAERPHAPRGEDIPIVLVLEEIPELLFWPLE